MTDILDTSDAPLSRTPARFFFETGYFAAYADASIRAGNRAPFELTDAIVDRAWEIAPEAHPDRREFDRYLSSADSADKELADAEAVYRAFADQNRDADGSREGLAVAASSLRVYSADLFPANRAGQVHFARVLMDSAASVIEAALTAQPPSQGRPVSEACGIAMVEVLDADRAELERGLFTQGFAPDRAHALAFSQPANDGALQMLARHRTATCDCPRSAMLQSVSRPVTGSELAEIEGWTADVKTRAIRLIAELATMTDTEADFLDGHELREVARLIQVPDDAGEIAPTLPRYYGEEDRSRAIAAIVARHYDGGTPIVAVAVKPGEIVDMIAEALGMRRAGA
ncbi:hypothetical protein [Sphingomonas hankookensis]|uniref:hypothetical protein n=1 Tax=Sphingomonas hankookensis TaxID=563996 RepID=UPI003D302251